MGTELEQEVLRVTTALSARLQAADTEEQNAIGELLGLVPELTASDLARMPNPSDTPVAALRGYVNIRLKNKGTANNKKQRLNDVNEGDHAGAQYVQQGKQKIHKAPQLHLAGYLNEEALLAAVAAGEFLPATREQQVAVASAMYKQSPEQHRARGKPGSPARCADLMVSLLQHQFRQQFLDKPGYVDEAGLRQDPLPDGDFCDLGSRFRILDRNSTAQAFARALKAIDERQRLQTPINEGAAYLGMLSVPGGGKTTATKTLIGLAIQHGSNVMGVELTQQLRTCQEQSMQYLFDFAEPDNQFRVDVKYDLHPEQSLSLRVLYALAGNGTEKTFTVFLKNLAQLSSAELFFKHLKVSHVLDAATSACKGTAKADGARHIIMDECGAPLEDTLEKQKQPGSAAERFRDMLLHWDLGSSRARGTQHASDPVQLLTITGTRLHLTLDNWNLSSNSGIAQAAFVPLTTISDQGVVEIIDDIYRRLPGAEGHANEKPMCSIIVAFAGGVPRLIEAMLVALAHVYSAELPCGDHVIRFNVNSSSLLTALNSKLDGGRIKTACSVALRMLKDRSPTLFNFLTLADAKTLGKAIVSAQFLSQPVTRRMEVVPGKPWGDLEGAGMCTMSPVLPADYNVDPLGIACWPDMPFLTFVGSVALLEGQGQVVSLGPEALNTFELFLWWQQKEYLDASAVLYKMMVRGLWMGEKHINLDLLLPLHEDKHRLYKGMVLQVPAYKQLRLEKRDALPDRDALEKMLLEDSVDAVWLHGPLNEKKVDWLLLFKVDQQHSSKHAKKFKWLVIQGQSKMHEQVGVGSISSGTVEKEYAKRVDLHSNQCAAKSLFVLVTDQEAPDDRSSKDILVIGHSQSHMLYGRARAKKRDIVSAIATS